MNEFTFVERKVLTACKINGLWYPANSTMDALRNFIEPALFYNEDFPEYQFSVRGTLTKCTFKGKYIAFITAHQTKDFTPDQLVILNSEMNFARSAENFLYAHDELHGEDRYDIRIYDFTSAVRQKHLSESNWFDLNQCSDLKLGSNASFALAFGFPSQELEIDYEQKRILTVSAFVHGKPVDSALAGRFALNVENVDSIDVDGFSGGGVFSYRIEHSEPKIELAGITTNASDKILNFTPIQTLKKYLAHL